MILLHNLVVFKTNLLQKLIKNRFSSEKSNFSSFSANFRLQAEVEKVTSRAEPGQADLKILGLDSSLVITQKK